MLAPPLILCPLAHEARLWHRFAPGLPRAMVVGPGPWAAAHLSSDLVAGRLVLLVGTAGGLRPPWQRGSAAVVRTIVECEIGTGNPLHKVADLDPPEGLPTVTLVTVRQPPCTPEEKSSLATASHADLVDCEASHVAHAVHAAGGRLLVVRGVSDGPSDPLPPQAARWIDDSGNTDLLNLGRDLLRSPRLLGSLCALAAGASQAMKAAAHVAAAALERMDLEGRSGSAIGGRNEPLCTTVPSRDRFDDATTKASSPVACPEKIDLPGRSDDR